MVEYGTQTFLCHGALLLHQTGILLPEAGGMTLLLRDLGNCYQDLIGLDAYFVFRASNLYGPTYMM
eukprot:9321624-Ditylum_brightwellii.AAC.1